MRGVRRDEWNNGGAVKGEPTQWSFLDASDAAKWYSVSAGILTCEIVLGERCDLVWG